MKKAARDVPKVVPTTGRTPHFLAKRYGYKSLSDFINDIPRNATVIDAGAGLSLLGHAVAKRRPDVIWLNLDPFYKNERHQAAASDAPPNVRYMAEDISKPSSKLAKLKVARIYSYWMLPHLSIYSDEPVRRVAGVMWDMLSPSGVIMVGPDYPYRFASLKKPARYIRFTKKDSREAVQNRMARMTRMPKLIRLLHMFQSNYVYGNVNALLNIFTSNQMRRARRTID